MKRFVGATGLVLGGLVAATAATSAAPVTITWAYWAFTGKEGDHLKQVAAQFMAEHPDINVELQGISGDVYTKLASEVAAGVAPDISWMAGNWYPSLAKNNMVLDLSPFIQKDKASMDFADFAPALIEVERVGDGQYGLPTDVNPVVMYYNTDQFQQAGVALPDDAWTWDKLRENAFKLTKKDQAGKAERWGIASFFGFFDGNFIFPVLWSRGAQVFDRFDGATKPTVKTNEFIDALNWIANLRYVDGVAPPAEAYNGLIGSDPLFANGKAAIALEHRGLENTLQTTSPGFAWNMSIVPQGSVKRATWLATAGWSILSTTKHPQESWTFLKWLTGPEGMNAYLGKNGAFPARRSVALQLVKDAGQVNEMAFIDSFPFASTGYKAVDFKKYGNIFWAQVNKVLGGQSSAGSAMATLDTQLAAFLKSGG